jgi:hypothetical protein
MRIKVAVFVLAGLSVGALASARGARAADLAAEQAKQHFFKGQQFFDVGRWDEAAEEFEKAYSMRGDPIFIYNMAQAYRRKGDAKRALDLYKNYLIKAPRSPQREEVEERIRSLQKQLDEAEYQVRPVAQNPVRPPPVSPGVAPSPAAPVPGPASTPPSAVPPAAPTSWSASPAPAPTPAVPALSPAVPAPTPVVPALAPAVSPTPAQTAYPAAAVSAGYPAEASPSASPSQPAYLQAQAIPGATPGRGLRVTGVVLGLTGVALVGAGIFCGAEASAYSHSVETGSVFNPDFEDRGKLYETLQWVGYGVGAGLVATGAVLYGMGVAAGKSPAIALTPALFPGGAGLGAQGVF